MRDRILAFVMVLVGALLATPGCGGSDRSGAEPADPRHADVHHYTCAMHPQIRQDQPGGCPICGMDLVPVPRDSAAAAAPEAARRLELSPEAARLAEIQTARVERRPVAVEVSLSGKLALDETRVREISSTVAGRLERLFVNFTGVEVAAGDPLVEVYSPELVSAQEELLQSLRAQAAVRDSTLEGVRSSSAALVAAARDKLRLLGLSGAQIAEIERSAAPRTRISLPSPLDGVVIHKAGVEGMYVKTGTHIYSVADLSHLWALLDAYETDLPWLRKGQPVTFTTASSPGRTFRGEIAFIDPVLDASTRTAKVRVDVSNPDARLKPEMFIRATVSAVNDADEERAELVIPATAPLVTGRRAVVYVRVDADTPTFEGREVVLGARAGDTYIVVHGLAEGEQIVTRGAFKIDSALQIQAKPSMMSSPGRSDAGSEGTKP